MATVRDSVYYDCLLEFRKEIASIITKRDFNVDRLTEKARKKRLLPSELYTRPDAFAPREAKVANLMFSCIESVRRNEQLFYNFLAILDEEGLQHLVRRIRNRLLEQGGDQKPTASIGPKPRQEQGGDQKPTGLKRSKIPPLSDDSGTVSASVGSSLPPLSRIATTSPSQQSSFHYEGGPKHMDQRRPRSAAMQSSSGYGTEKQPSLEPLILKFPAHAGRSSMLPLEETHMEDLVPDNEQRLFLSDHFKNTIFEEQQAQSERAGTQKETQTLPKDKETLQKELEEKEIEINELQTRHQRNEREKDEHIKRLEEQRAKDEKELERLRTRTAQLEKELEQKNKDYEELKNHFSEKEQEMKIQHKQDVEKIRKELLEEKAKADIEIKGLENKLLQKDLEKQKLLHEYKERERTLERERDALKVQLTELRLSMLQKKYRQLQQEREAEKRKALQERRKSLATIEELQRKQRKS